MLKRVVFVHSAWTMKHTHVNVKIVEWMYWAFEKYRFLGKDKNRMGVTHWCFPVIFIIEQHCSTGSIFYFKNLVRTNVVNICHLILEEHENHSVLGSTYGMQYSCMIMSVQFTLWNSIAFVWCSKSACRTVTIHSNLPSKVLKSWSL